ncbi:LytT Response regulator of the LytR/AlgR family [Spirosomataceae bacterium]|jgi:DNA-binding LytR/AlgR family response regulator
MNSESINVLILEDDLFFQTSLRYMLKDSQFNIVCTIDNLNVLQKCLDENEIDIFICGLNIEGEYIKREVLLKISMLGIPIICVTATLDEGIYNEIKDIVSGYLVKPFHKLTLHSTLTLSLKQFRKDKLLDFMDQKYLFIRTHGSVLEKFNFSDILYLESQGNYCYIYTRNRKLIEKISLTKLLKYKLDVRFKRVHRKYAINTEYLESLGAAELILLNNQKIPMSPTFKSNLNDIIRRKLGSQ